MANKLIEQGLTCKIRLYPTADQAEQFSKLVKEYQRLCNLASKYAFAHNIILQAGAQKLLNDSLYYQFKAKTFLKSQLIQSVFKTVLARYKTVKTQLAKNPFRYYSKETNKTYYCKRDLSWLWHPVLFNRPQIDLVRNRNYSLTGNADQISMAGLEKRLKVKYDLNCKSFLLRKDIKLGTAKLVKACGHWFLHVSYTVSLDSLQNNDAYHVVGIDRGQRFIVACYDEKGKTFFVSGKKLLAIRRHYKKLRQRLQAKNTKSAKRRLKQIGQRENRYMTDVNHKIAKALVDRYDKNTIFALEDLTGVVKASKKRSQDERYEAVSWPFYQLQTLLEYKARLNHSKVVYVDPFATSQRCPKCGRINKDNRSHHYHLYACDRCGYKSNDDRLAAMNIQFLGTLTRAEIERPSFNNHRAKSNR